MAAAYISTTTLTLVVTLVLGGNGYIYPENDVQVATSSTVDTTDDADGIIEDDLRSQAFQILIGSDISRATCKQKNKCRKKDGSCQETGTCPGKSVKGCSRGCSCCLPIPTADKCADEGGVCAITGNRCSGTLTVLKNSCNDQCICCIPDKECVSPWVSTGNGQGCFLFVQNETAWINARTDCQALGADLAILDTEDKIIEMVKYMEISGLKNIGAFWLGANDRSGSWLWLNSNPLTVGWKVGQEPDDDVGDDTCAYIYTKPYPSGRYDLLFDYYCTYAQFNYICEK